MSLTSSGTDRECVEGPELYGSWITAWKATNITSTRQRDDKGVVGEERSVVARLTDSLAFSVHPRYDVIQQIPKPSRV